MSVFVQIQGCHQNNNNNNNVSKRMADCEGHGAAPIHVFSILPHNSHQIDIFIYKVIFILVPDVPNHNLTN